LRKAARAGRFLAASRLALRRRRDVRASVAERYKDVDSKTFR
jgi:hypothetical protein